MPIEIIVPRLGWSMEEGAFVAWLKKDGELVRAGEPLFSIESDKAVQEIESIDSGILRIAPNAPKPGQPIRVGDVLGHLLSTHEGVPGTPSSSPSTTAPGATSEPRSSRREEALSHRGTTAQQVESPPREIRQALPSTLRPAISPRALRVAAELGVDWSTIIGTGKTGRIREKDIRAAADSGRSRSLTATLPVRTSRGWQPTVLVTGGSGFIGTWVLRELLSRELQVVALDASAAPERWERILGPGCRDVPLVRGSLLNRELLSHVFDTYAVTHVIHLAALLTPACQTDPWEGCRVNILGSVALFEEARRRMGRVKGLAYASSVAVFGEEPDHRSAAHQTENEPPTFYGAFKKSVELIARQYWNHFRVRSVGIRPQVAYGPERETGLTAGPSLAARAVARGEPFCIGYTGRVGYDYVEDVARAFVRSALEAPAGAHVVDLGGESADVTDVIRALTAVTPNATAKLSASGLPIPAHTPPNPRYISTLFPDWQTTSLAEGIRRTVDFYRVQPVTTPL